MDHSPPLSEPKGLRNIARALRSRNYRLYFFGQGVSLIGTWMQQVALGWLVYRLSNSALLLGTVAFVSQVPTMLLTPFGGVLADRWNRYRTMMIIQSAQMILALVLAILVLAKWIQIPHILILGLLTGFCNAIDAPTRHAFLIDLVEDRRDLSNAVALNSAIFNSARLLGPSFAGLIIAWLGEGVCFLLNSISFLAIILALAAMHIQKQQDSPSTANGIFNELKEGVIYTYQNKHLRLILLHFAWVAFAAMSFTVLIPVLAKDILGGGAKQLGFLMGALGLGALASALLFASRRHDSDFWKICGFSSILFGFSLIFLSVSRNFLPSLIFMGLAGFGMISQMITTNTILQKSVADDKRARVLSFYLFAFFGTVPLGYLLMGFSAKHLGTAATLGIAGLAALVGATLYLFSFMQFRKKSSLSAIR